MGWNFWKSELFRAAPEKSIAVLPFQNLSPDPDNAYFADGIQEEILTRLAGIADLKVISRTSTQRYQSKPRNLSQIAKQLGVANILEGSVQKAADQVRVSVQLINAQTDSHLWAETYDRKLTDILLVESEIAKGIAESLQAKLTGREKQALAVKPTNNPEAYDAYLRGLAFEAALPSVFSEIVAKAASFFERAVQLDPNFALAWARLSRAEAINSQRLRLWGRRIQTCFGECTETGAELARNAARAGLLSSPGCCMITGLPKPRSVASARCYQATARCYWLSAESPAARNIGMKPSPMPSKLSPWTHATWSYSWTRQSPMGSFDSFRGR